MYKSILFASFNQLCTTFGLGSTDFFRFFQLQTHSPQFPQAASHGGIDLVLQAKSLPKGHISFLYNLLSPTNDTFVNKIRADWEAELQVNISDPLWKKTLKAVNSSSSCARLS